MPQRRIRALAGLLAVLAIGSALATADVFQIKIENLSPNVLSPAVFITHDSGFDFFDQGAPASSAVELIAESGNTTGLVALANANLGGTVSDYNVAGAAPITQGNSATIMLTTDMAHPYLSFESMMGVSNDGFIGSAYGDGAIDLFPGGSPFFGSIMIMPADVWDAGTEVNDESATTVGALGGFGGVDENGVITKPHPGILGVGDIPLSFNWTGGPVARITIVPEPSSLALVGLAVTGLFIRRRSA